MNSSGIKRGLAVSAISALAVAGIPALASPASADTGDVLTVASVGPARNGGTEGALVRLNTSGIIPSNLEVIGTNLTSPATNGTQAVAIVGRSAVIASGSAQDTTPGDGLAQIVLEVTVTTPTAGDTANFVVFEDEADTDLPNDNPDAGPTVRNGAVDADEARTAVAVQTSGPVASVDITPANQTSPAGVASAPYTVTVRDSANRLTQLTGLEDLDLTVPAGSGVTFSGVAADNAITAEELQAGTVQFRATGTGFNDNNTPNVPGDDTDGRGLQTITVRANSAAGEDPLISGSDTATLDVVDAAAGLTRANIDVQTEADSFDGFGDNGQVDNPIAVRVDQSTVRIAINSPANAGATVVLAVNGADQTPNANPNNDGNGLTFGGETETTVSTTLDENGRGSVTIAPDAGSIQVSDDFTVAGAGLNLTFEYQRAELSRVVAPADVYVSAIDGSVDITVTATDQFGDPVAGAQVDARRTSQPNLDAAAQPRKTTDANGQATFTFTDVNANPGQTTEVTFRAFADQFDAIANATDTTDIRYTQSGQGAEFTLSLDGVNTGGASYSPDDVVIQPLTDTAAQDTNTAADEIARLALIGGEAGAPVTVSVDNGARILTANDDNRLASGSASETGVVGDTFRIIGTESGVVTVTVTSAGRTETAQFTVAAQSDVDAARNVSVSGPATAVTGDEQVTYTAVVTDAFGNPIEGFDADDLNIQVTGPGAFQDSDSESNANGEIQINVRLDDDANGTVTIRVRGLDAQFGADANRIDEDSNTDDAEGLPASIEVATASTNVQPGEPEPTVREPITATAAGSNRASDGFDRVRISVDKPEAAADAAVELWKINKQGKARRVKTKSLNAKGMATWIRVDNNGKNVSRYFAKVRPTDTSKSARSNTVRIK
ncbi:beta strand repeat-containing protein [Nocardioides abyssi]|uniref:Ig-like domain-containing protein n=1 Tax=Nocardioides abyssi TaxID=3058370 RepID=A0ABT8EQC8_9ACTN|nr:Ig-like domain-containing protein [Nocardioides abyssi]MDN4160218.1 Ig-like domain-containing protein [Nocardioides abyssi]